MRLSNHLVHKYDPETSSFSTTRELVTHTHWQAHPDPKSARGGGRPPVCTPLRHRGRLQWLQPAAASVDLALPRLDSRLRPHVVFRGRFAESVLSSAVQSHHPRMSLCALEQFHLRTCVLKTDTLTCSHGTHRTAAAHSCSWRKRMWSVQAVGYIQKLNGMDC